MVSKHVHSIAADGVSAAHLSAAIGRPIALVGLMGVGKSSVGKRLAKRLRLPFVDADDEIEAAHDLSIAEIFEKYGEDYFRDGERRVIARLIDGEPKVVATGGGAFCDAETRRLIKQRALSIWIDADINTLVARVSRRDSRPLLRGRDPRAVLTDLARARNPFYAEADLKVLSGQASPETMVERIAQAIANHAEEGATSEHAEKAGRDD
jgi:shikimate kinase